ncbi:MAG: hypothetical protein GX811_13840, partial [Lentisphaerae bacterium]|nr:hypothetical protein [Lentisphaerota bacterium]
FSTVSAIRSTQQRQEELFVAITKNDITLIENIASSGKGIINAKNPNGMSPLHLAIGQNKKEALAALLNLDADPNIRDFGLETPLIYAVRIKDVNSELIEVLLQKGADPNARDGKNRTALHHIADIDNQVLTVMLLKYNADINARDEQGLLPIDYAITAFRFKMAAYLADAGSITTVHHAAVIQNIVVLKKLVESDPNRVISIDSFGKTPLHWAVVAKNHNAVKYLLHRRARVNAQDKKGRTPLHEAAAVGNEELVHLLLSFKADPSLTDKEGNTPANEAEKIGHLNLAKALNVEAKQDLKH